MPLPRCPNISASEELRVCLPQWLEECAERCSCVTRKMDRKSKVCCISLCQHAGIKPWFDSYNNRLPQVESLLYPAEMWCAATLPYASTQLRPLLTVFGNGEIAGEQGDPDVRYHTRKQGCCSYISCVDRELAAPPPTIPESFML